MDGHLSQDLIFRTLDDELTMPERFECESHLAVCEVCRLQMASLHEFSMRIEAAVHATRGPAMDGVRQQIQKEIEARNLPAPVLQNPAKVMRRFAWGVGIAATLAFGVLMTSPSHDFWTPAAVKKAAPVEESASGQTSSIEVDGETFVPVPYSNADLQTATPHIVQMQVPISSLADVGIVLEPITNREGEADSERSVLADVLVGADGQPRGVHVLSFE
jgi:anti-sigma factor RsiW